jgi:hypothetical protein
VDQIIGEIRRLSGLLNGTIPDGQLNETKSKTLTMPRYMLTLYAASNIIFEDLQDEELDDGFTLSSLLKVAKKLNLKFDRTKTSIKIYEKQIKKNRVNVFEKNNRKGYKLSDEGKKCCEEIMLTLPELEDNFNNNPDRHLYTKEWDEELEKNVKHVQTLSPEEFQEWDNANKGKLFRQPTEGAELIEKLFKTLEELDEPEKIQADLDDDTKKIVDDMCREILQEPAYELDFQYWGPLLESGKITKDEMRQEFLEYQEEFNKNVKDSD